MKLDSRSNSLVFFTLGFRLVHLPILNFQHFTYIPAPLGSIPELPARSWREITASEGKNTTSNKYWLDPSGTGKAVLVYCDMNLEGKSSLRHC